MITLREEESYRSSYLAFEERSGQFRPPAISAAESDPAKSMVFGGLGNEAALYSRALRENKRSRALAPGHAPVRAILKLQEFWGLSDAEMLAICGLPAEDDQGLAIALVRYLKVPAVKARLTSLMVIRSRLSALLGGDQESERRWLVTPWAQLGGLSALIMMRRRDTTGLLSVEAQVRELSGI